MDNLNIIKKWIWRILLFASIIEGIIFYDYKNIFGSIVLIYGWWLISTLILKRQYIYNYFIPFCCLFGYAFIHFFLPIIATLIEGKPLTFMFQVPYLTFTNQALNITTIVLAFKLCVFAYNKKNILSHIWEKIGLFKAPTDKQLWVIGLIGFISLILSLQLQGTEAAKTGNMTAIEQSIFQLRILSVAPVCLYFRKMYNSKSYSQKHSFLIIYIIFSILIGIATTRRAIVLSTIETISLAYLVTILLKKKKLFSAKTNIIIISGIYLLTGPLADLSTSMILNRQLVYSSSGKATFSKVLELYNDKEKLHNMYQLWLSTTDNGGKNENGWSEYYVDNIFLDRLCNLRVVDATLYYAQNLGFNNQVMHNYLGHYLLFQIPAPILKLFGYKNNKFEYNYTPGDLISTNSLNLKEQYRGFRIAGDTGIGLYLWGYYYYLIAFFIHFVTFYFLSSLTKYKKNNLIIPIPIIISLFSYFMYFNNGIGIFKSISLLMRIGIQSIILYCFIFYIARSFIKK